MKIYVITIDEVCDYETAVHKPILLFSRQEVKDTIKQIKDKAKKEFPSDWEIHNTSDGGFAIFLMGEYSNNHYVVTVYDYDVKMNITP